MKASMCFLMLVATAVFAAEEKKTEKRGVLGLGYGGYAAAPVLGHGLYGHGLGHGLGLYNHGLYGSSLYGHGLYGSSLYGSSLYGHPGLVAPPVLGHGYYGSAAPLHYGAPLLGLGHGGGYLH